MRIRCLVIDRHGDTLDRICATLNKYSLLDVHPVNASRDSMGSIHAIQPNVILFRYGESSHQDERFLSVVERLKWKCALIPLLSHPQSTLIESLLRQKLVVDIITEDAENARIETAIRKALIFLHKATDRKTNYRGFLGFVGIVPSLRERKILSDAGIGMIQNRSLRLAIDYWRKNPNSQLIGVALNTFETMTSRPDELIDYWDDFDLRPWEIGLYEAQRHYLEYWKTAIHEGLLPCLISTLLREGSDDLTPMLPEEIQRVLVKVGQMTRLGTIEEIFQAMKVTFRVDSQSIQSHHFDEFIGQLEKQLEEVDKKHPELTRPPTETGYEDFVPDIAIPSSEEMVRMAYQQKKW